MKVSASTCEPENKPMRQVAWLIERADPRGEDRTVLANHFLGMSGYFDGVPSHSSGTLMWMSDVNNALRFLTEKDANMFIAACEALHDLVPHKDTLAGLRHGEPRAIAVDHAWDWP